MALPKFVERSYAGDAPALQLLGPIGATDLSFTADPTVGSFANWPTGSGGVFSISLDQGIGSFEKILCSGFNVSTGVYTVWTDGPDTGRGYDGTEAVSHVVQTNIPQIQLIWTAVEAQEANDVVVAVMGGAATGSSGDVLTIAGGAPTWASPGGAPTGLFPIGGVLMWAATALPTGFLLCNGQLVSTTTYAALFAILSTTYGSGSGTFGLPDFRAVFPVGVGTGIAATVGAKGGSTTQSTSQMPSHSHGVTDPQHTHDTWVGDTSHSVVTTDPSSGTTWAAASGPLSVTFANATFPNAATGISIDNEGSGDPFIQPFIGMNFIIRAL